MDRWWMGECRMSTEILIPESRNLSVALFFPAIGFTFITYMAIKDITGTTLLAIFLAGLVCSFFIFLWCSVVRSINRISDDVTFAMNANSKKVYLPDMYKIKVVRGPLSRSVLIIMWSKKRAMPAFIWSAFNDSSVGNYNATIQAINNLLSNDSVRPT
jgi:hypothetical protein